jgi:hypothetical protein
VGIFLDSKILCPKATLFVAICIAFVELGQVYKLVGNTFSIEIPIRPIDAPITLP